MTAAAAQTTHQRQIMDTDDHQTEASLHNVLVRLGGPRPAVTGKCDEARFRREEDATKTKPLKSSFSFILWHYMRAQ